MPSVFTERPNRPPKSPRVWLWGWLWVWVWLPALVACCVIAFESTGTMGASNTSRWLRPFFEAILGHLSDPRWDEIHHIIRKTGHFTGYGAVCWTFLRAWLLTLAPRANLTVAQWRLRACALAVLCTAIVASCDEWHQTFIPGRTGQASDALLDTCGGLVLCTLVWLFCWHRTG